MHSVAVVKPLDAIDDTGVACFMRLELFVVDLFYFEASIKAFHRRVCRSSFLYELMLA